jgi:hypothetical protein
LIACTILVALSICVLFFVDNIFFIVVVVVGELQTQREQHKLTIVMDASYGRGTDEVISLSWWWCWR